MRRSASLSSCALLILAACAGKTGDDDGGDDTAGEAGASAAPTVQIGRPVAGTDHSETEPLVFEASVSDDEDAPDALVLSWTDASGAVLGSTGSDASGFATFTLEAPTPGGYEITLTATDTDGGVGSDTVSLTVGGAPGAPGVAIEPASPLSIDALQAVITEEAVDPEGDALTYRYAWTVDGEDAEFTEPDLPGEETARGEVWVVEVYADDGLSEGIAGSAEVVIGNTPPSLDGVELAPTEAFAGDTLVCTPGLASDVDGDPVTMRFEWTVDGVSMTETTRNLGPEFFDKGQVVSCVVTPDDGIEAGQASASNPVTISNTLPVLDGATLSPDPATTTDTLTCTPGVATDVDGDRITFATAWTVDGVVSSETTDVLSASEFSRDQLVGCTVTPSDDEADGAPASTSLTVSNTPPTEPTISVSPTDAIEGVDDLLCSVDVDATDADGDAPIYTISWSVDGTSHTGTASTTIHAGDTLPAGETVAGETWSCSVETSDGTDSAAGVTSAGVVVLPSEVIYDITLADLFNQGSSCSSTPDETVYNGCSGDWGFSWTDTGSVSPDSVTVELNHGLNCSSSTTKSTDLNGVSSGTFSMAGGACTCNPTASVYTWDLTNVSGYAVGASNTLTVGHDGSCEGLTVNSSWGSGIYARVTVQY